MNSIGRRYRTLGWMWIILFAYSWSRRAAATTWRRPPMLLAAGSVLWEGWAASLSTG